MSPLETDGPVGPGSHNGVHTTVSDAVRRDVLRAAVELRCAGPVPIVFATASFGALLDNWLAHASRAGVGGVLVTALDDELTRRPVPAGCRVVHAPFDGELSQLWLFRLSVLEALAMEGVDFIHSDLDAVWLADPRPECFANPTLDAVFSQGTYHPEQAYAAWGFVLCCGLFAVRARGTSADFLAAVRSRARTEGDDQAAVNLVLLENDMTWSGNRAGSYTVQFAGRSMVCHHDMLRGSVERLGLNIGLLPHHRYPRLAGSWAEAVVRHPSSPREPAAKIPVLREAGCWFARPSLRPQMVIFSYHKSGTTLFHRIMHALAARLGLSIRVQYGMVYDIDADADIVLLPHSMLGFSLARNYRAVRITRDPRDIWVSSYLYHCRTAEGWCVNTNFDPTPPITYPLVDFSMLHRPERWKRAWLARLGGKSYQRNLQERDLAGGLAFELEGYTSTTLAAMSAWRPLPGVLDVKLENIAAAFDTTMTRVFRHLGLTDQECTVAMDIAATEDVNRKDDAAIAADPHIHSRVLSKWRDVLTAEQVQTFEQRYAGLVRVLGYELTPAP